MTKLSCPNCRRLVKPEKQAKSETGLWCPLCGIPVATKASLLAMAVSKSARKRLKAQVPDDFISRPVDCCGDACPKT